MSSGRVARGHLVDAHVPHVHSKMENEFEVNAVSPIPLLRSFLGVPQYATYSLLNEVNSPFVCGVEVADLFFKDFGMTPLSNLHNLSRRVPSVICGRGTSAVDSCVSMTSNTLTFNAMGGRKSVTVKDFTHRIGLENPKMVVVPADEVPLNSSWSRMSKAHQKSVTWLTQTIQGLSHSNSTSTTTASTTTQQPLIFGVALPSRPLRPPSRSQDNEDSTETATVATPSNGTTATGGEGGFEIKEEVIDSIVASVKLLLGQDTVNGIAIGGLGMGESIESLTAVLVAVRAAVDADTRRLPVLVQGMHTIEQVTTCLRYRVDIIGTAVADIMTANREALNTNVLPEGQVNGDGKAEEVAEVIIHKKRKAEVLSESESPSSSAEARNAAESKTSDAGHQAIKITNPEYERDMTPLVRYTMRKNATFIVIYLSI